MFKIANRRRVGPVLLGTVGCHEKNINGLFRGKYIDVHAAQLHSCACKWLIGGAEVISTVYRCFSKGQSTGSGRCSGGEQMELQWCRCSENDIRAEEVVGAGVNDGKGVDSCSRSGGRGNVPGNGGRGEEGQETLVQGRGLLWTTPS